MRNAKSRRRAGSRNKEQGGHKGSSAADKKPTQTSQVESSGFLLGLGALR